jgi:RHS repeat-associated protein
VRGQTPQDRISRHDNGLNQYLNWTPSAIYYDDNHPGPPARVPPGNGVMMAEGWITASFNALNQPMAIWSQAYGSNFLWFGFDPLGRCVKRWRWTATGVPVGSNPTTYYYYDGSDLVQEGLNASAVDRTYVYGGRVDEVVASQVSGVWYNHHYDGQGNCILLSTINGGLQEQYDYDAFGFPYFYTASGNKLLSIPRTRFLFTGREWLSDLRIYDYRNRQYQPELGRFLQPDPKEFAAGDYNIYRYCHNDPVNRSDPTGLDTLIIWNVAKDGSNNPFGHVALATTGQGVQSVGNGDNAGSNYSHASTTDYLAAQAGIRNTLLFTVRTTAEQEQKINAYFDSLANVRAGSFADNCAERTSEALKAAGLAIQRTHTPQSVFEQAKRVLGGTQTEIKKGESGKAGQYSSFNPADSSGNSRLVTPIGSHIPKEVNDE